MARRDREWDVGDRVAGRLRDVGRDVGRGLGEVGRELGQVGRGLAPRVPRLVERRSHSMGRAPGVLPEPDDAAPPARVTAFHYTEDAVEEHAGLSADEARALAERPGVTWINVDGVADTATVAAFGRAFGLHPLIVEDLVNTTQRPKIETYGDDLFVVARMIRATALDAALAYTDADHATPGHLIEQVGFVIGDGYVLSFQEDEGDVFDAVRDRLRRGTGRLRAGGADYLLYALLDLVVDHLFVTLERIGDAAEALEAQALDEPAPQVQAAISALRREVVVLRRSVWPLREVLVRLQDEDALYVDDRTRLYLRDAADHLVQALEIVESLREVLARLQDDDAPFVTDPTRLYLRDAADHLVQALEVVESLREVLASTNDLYLSAVGTRQNEVMKVLTVVGTIFLPLGFLTGLYGMNFEYIPELGYHYGYFVLWGVMALVTLGALTYFRKNDWI